jgi:hypothetical protein
MPYQEKAHIILNYLRANFPKCSVGHRWDFKLESEWYFLQKEKLRIRILVPKMFFDSNDGEELEAMTINGTKNYHRGHQANPCKNIR